MKTKRGPGRPKALPNNRLLKILNRIGYTQQGLADQLKISKQSVNYWCRIGVPANRCHDVARILPCSLNELRPDLFRK